MAVAKIQSIIGVRSKVSRYGQEGFVTKAIVDGDEVSCWQSKDATPFKVGDEVYTWFDDRYNRGGFKRIPLTLTIRNDNLIR